MDVARFVANMNDVILNCSYRDMEVKPSYLKSLHRTGTMKQSLLSYNIVEYIKLTILIIMT